MIKNWRLFRRIISLVIYERKQKFVQKTHLHKTVFIVVEIKQKYSHYVFDIKIKHLRVKDFSEQQHQIDFQNFYKYFEKN